MTLSQSTVSGALAGAGLAFAVCMFNDISFSDCLYRMGVLAIGGGWVGFLLAWLNDILPRENQHKGHIQ